MSKRTKAQTPAPKKDRITGSKKNPKGSASGSRGGIEISDRAQKALENLRDKHNDRYNAKSKQVDLGTLKAVFRRGAGAFSVSHRPGMDRTQWGIARVKAFLKLVGTGERKKAYDTDLDLLPKGHPQRTEKKSETLAVPDKYSHIDFTPPKGAQEAAKRALEVRADKPSSQRGMTPVGIARARDLMNGETLSPDTVRRMLNYFTRHEVDKEGSTWNTQGKGWQAWHGWGGDAGFAWARKVVKQMNAADDKAQALRAYGEAVMLSEASPTYDIPEGLTIGKPFKTLALGQVSSRMNGEAIGKEINRDLLTEMIRVYRERREADPVIIDWQHATSPFQGGHPAPPESGSALGLIVDLELREDGLYATPAYNERGLDVVKSAGGILWSSPEFLNGEVFSRDGGSKVGDAQLLAITLTPRPAQSNDKIGRVTLNERLAEMDNIEELSVEELRQLLIAKDEMVKELEQKMKDMMEESESSMMEKEDDKEEKMTEDEEKETKMAHTPDHEEKKEEEKKDYKMSETLTENTLLSEVQALRENNAKLSERLEAIEAEKREVERREAVNTLLNEGKIQPSEVEVAGKAWELRELQGEFWQMFSERPSNSAVPLVEVGHGASGQEINKATLDQEVRNLAAEKQVSYSEALHLFRESNRDYYNKVFGG
ncbi:MAG: hypothetical protein NWF14_05845 [Candidatus Bathyarchaeota archaeon]|nr:hypothetical protein [Candidatus Bathyarchaeota archaeon]